MNLTSVLPELSTVSVTSEGDGSHTLLLGNISLEISVPGGFELLQGAESTDSKSETLESLSDKGRSSLTVLMAVFSFSSSSTRSPVLHDTLVGSTLFGKTATKLVFE